MADSNVKLPEIVEETKTVVRRTFREVTVPAVWYEYMPLAGRLPGQSFEDQTEDFLNDLSLRVTRNEQVREVVEQTVERVDKLETDLSELEKKHDKDIEDINTALANKMDRDFGNATGTNPIEHGGTGADNAPQARENLGITDNKLLPDGGEVGQVLGIVAGETEGATAHAWIDQTGGGADFPEGGTAGQVLGLVPGAEEGTTERAWIDQQGAVGEAPEDGETYGRQDGEWVPLASDGGANVIGLFTVQLPNVAFLGQEIPFIGQMVHALPIDKIMCNVSIIPDGTGTPVPIGKMTVQNFASDGDLSFKFPEFDGKMPFRWEPPTSYVVDGQGVNVKAGDVYRFNVWQITDVLKNSSDSFTFQAPQRTDVPVAANDAWPIGKFLSWNGNISHSTRTMSGSTSAFVADTFGAQAVTTSVTADILTSSGPTAGAGSLEGTSMFASKNNMGYLRAIYNGIMVLQNATNPSFGNNVAHTVPTFDNQIFRTTNGYQFINITDAIREVLPTRLNEKYRYPNIAMVFAASPDGIYGLSQYGDLVKSTDGENWTYVTTIPETIMSPLGRQKGTGATAAPCGSTASSAYQDNALMLLVIPRVASQPGYRLLAFFTCWTSSTGEGYATNYASRVVYTYSDDAGATWADLAFFGQYSSTGFINSLGAYQIHDMGGGLILALKSSLSSNKYTTISRDYGATWLVASSTGGVPDVIRNRLWDPTDYTASTKLSGLSAYLYALKGTVLAYPTTRTTTHTAAAGDSGLVSMAMEISFTTCDPATPAGSDFATTTRNVLVELPFNTTKFGPEIFFYDPTDNKLCMNILADGRLPGDTRATSEDYYVYCECTWPLDVEGTDAIPVTVIDANSWPQDAGMKNRMYICSRLSKADLRLVPAPEAPTD